MATFKSLYEQKSRTAEDKAAALDQLSKASDLVRATTDADKAQELKIVRALEKAPGTSVGPFTRPDGTMFTVEKDGDRYYEVNLVPPDFEVEDDTPPAGPTTPTEPTLPVPPADVPPVDELEVGEVDENGAERIA